MEHLLYTLPDPLLIWGIFTRLVGLSYFWALVQLLPQIMPLAGSSGLFNVSLKLQQIKKDYPGWRKWTLFPSLLWFSSSDRFMKGLLIAGCLSSLWAVYGGPWAEAGIFIAWMVYLSMDIPVTLSYPWDSVLFEMGFLSLLLPAIRPLPYLEATELPYEPVSWVFRLLLFRLIFGFGKFRFSGTNLKDSGYFKAFSVNIPLPTYASWYMYRFPPWFFQFILLFTFLVEVIAPPFIFVTETTRLLACVLIVVLMIAIQLVGNFGFFNLITIVLCVPLLDTHASLFNLRIYDLFQPLTHLSVNLLLLVLLIGYFFHYFFNSWCTFTWLHWPSALRIPSPLLTALLDFYRLIIRFRIVHSYGVFPPESSPPIKWSAVFEGSNDDVNWKSFEYKYYTSTPYSPPRVVAPFHPRFDHSILYDSVGTNDASFLSSTLGSGDPYKFTHASPMEAVMQRLLEGNASTYSLFGKTPFHYLTPPKYMRVAFYQFQPTSIRDKRATGRWWKQEYAGIEHHAIAIDPVIEQKTKTQPELFHWDAVFWRRWCPSIQVLLKAVYTDKGTRLIERAEAGLSEGTKDFFWTCWRTAIRQQNADWRLLPALVKKMEDSYGYFMLKQTEIYWARLSIILGEKLLPLHLDKTPLGKKTDNYFIFGLFLHHLILKGKHTVLTVLDDSGSAYIHLADFNPKTAFYSYAFFRYNMLLYLSAKLRLVLRFSPLIKDDKMLPGFSRLIHFVSTLFENVHEEHFPDLFCDPVNGRWYVNGVPT